jgi:hypothetical protein
VHAAVGSEQLRTDDARLGVLSQFVSQGLECARRQERVGVEQQDQFALTAAQGQVVAVREATIARRANQRDPRELELDHVGRAVGRGVVDDEDFAYLLYGRQAGSEVLARVVVQDDYREIRHATPTG